MMTQHKIQQVSSRNPGTLAMLNVYLNIRFETFGDDEGLSRPHLVRKWQQDMLVALDVKQIR
jgi:hypothetical protein